MSFGGLLKCFIISSCFSEVLSLPAHRKVRVMALGGFALALASFAFKSSAFFFLRTKGRMESTGTYSFCTTGGLPYWKALQKCDHQSFWKCAGWSEAMTTWPICFPYFIAAL